MVKIIIKRDDLLRQMPREGVELPATLILDGLPFDESAVPEREYPDVWQVCTGVEWEMFCELADKGAVGSSVRELAKFLQRNKDVFVSNNVAVHIKGLRKTFRQWSLPFAIHTKRMGHESGRYILEEL